MTKPKTKPAPAPGAFPDTAPAEAAATAAVASVSPIAAIDATNAPPDLPAPPVAAAPVPEAPVGYMMQPKLLGYRHLTERDARLINRIKAAAKGTRELAADLELMGAAPDDLALAVQHLKVGFSLLTRSVAKPSEW